MAEQRKLILYCLDDVSENLLVKYADKLPLQSWAYVLSKRKLRDTTLFMAKKLTWQFIARHSKFGITIRCFQDKTKLDLANKTKQGAYSKNLALDKLRKKRALYDKPVFLEISQEDWELFFSRCNYGHENGLQILQGLLDDEIIFFDNWKNVEIGFDVNRMKEALNNNEFKEIDETIRAEKFKKMKEGMRASVDIQQDSQSDNESEESSSDPNEISENFSQDDINQEMEIDDYKVEIEKEVANMDVDMDMEDMQTFGDSNNEDNFDDDDSRYSDENDEIDGEEDYMNEDADNISSLVGDIDTSTLQ